MIDWLASHWNDALTVITFLLSGGVAYHQIQYYRSQGADLSIKNVKNTYAKSIEQAESIVGYQYNLAVDVQNDGRDLATVSGAALRFDDGDELDLYNSEASRWSNVDIKTRETVGLRGVEHTDQYRDSATLKLSTTDGELTTRVDFS